MVTFHMVRSTILNTKVFISEINLIERILIPLVLTWYSKFEIIGKRTDVAWKPGILSVLPCELNSLCLDDNILPLDVS
jgi:hypothetical protein